jgi:hypothetical protein
MNRLAAALLFCMLTATTLAAPALAAKPKVGDVLADVEVSALLTPNDAAALGLKAGKVRCHTDAPKVNQIFQRLAASPKARGLTFVALGVGDSPLEVEAFRKKHKSPMPMIPDTDYVLHKALMSVGAPSYFVLRPLPGGKGLKVLFFLEGGFDDENDFFNLVLRAAAQK